MYRAYHFLGKELLKTLKIPRFEVSKKRPRSNNEGE